MDCGLTENEFWSMSLDEVIRFMQSYSRKKSIQQKEVLTYLHTLADLAGISMVRFHKQGFEFPSREKVWPDIFIDDAYKERVKRDSAQRFLAFAHAYNLKHAKEK